MTKFTVIIPVYNVEKYIRDCIDSVLEQDYKNLEIILVDDGSSDSSPKICDEYGLKFDRVKVIHKSNEGLSSARNVGVKHATGEYIIFLDSDDWIHKDFINLLSQQTKNNKTDVVVIGVLSYSTELNKYSQVNYKLPSTVISGVEAFKFLYNQKNFWGAAWQFVVKTDFLINNKISFVKGIYHEDERYSPELLLLASSVGFSSNSFYINRSGRFGSIINSKNIKKEYDKIFVINQLTKLARYQFTGLKSDLLLSRCASIYIGLLKSSSGYADNNEELWDKIHSIKNILLSSKLLRHKMFYGLIQLFGVKAASKWIALRRIFQ